MKKLNISVALCSCALVALLASCGKQPAYYQFEQIQPGTASVLWNPEDFDFEAANTHYLNHLSEILPDSSAAACSSWRNGHFHGRNLDWYQGDYGCLIVRMPKGGKVRHASVGLLNAISSISRQFVQDGQLSDDNRRFLPCNVVDGINDAGLAVNINIVPHDPASAYVSQGDLSSLCVVRYLLDNAGSVGEAIRLLEKRSISQSIVPLAGDEAHYMISGQDMTAVVEWDNAEMQVTYFLRTDSGFYSSNHNPAIMTNLYDFAVERWQLGSDEFFQHHPYAMGVERWDTICKQYAAAAESVESNLRVAQSVWYFRSFMTDKQPWYSENAVPSGYGKDEQGWFYMADGQRFAAADYREAQLGYWNAAMDDYWATYDSLYAVLPDPHSSDNHYWETSHTVIYDLQQKQGYLYPYENFFSPDGAPILLTLPE